MGAHWRPFEYDQRGKLETGEMREHKVELESQELSQVKEFVYLDSIVAETAETELEVKSGNQKQKHH